MPVQCQYSASKKVQSNVALNGVRIAPVRDSEGKMALRYDVMSHSTEVANGSYKRRIFIGIFVITYCPLRAIH